jgi:hypothetical protein
MILCFIFIPKIHYQRELQKQDSETKSRVRLSLANDSHSELLFFGRSNPLADESGGYFGRLHGGLFGDDDTAQQERPSGSGERILAIKSQEELAKQVEALCYLLSMERKTADENAEEISKLRGILRANGLSPDFVVAANESKNKHHHHHQQQQHQTDQQQLQPETATAATEQQ